MTVTTTFEIDQDGIDELAQSEEVMDALRATAEAICEVARGYAPRNQRSGIDVLGEEPGVVYAGTANPFAHLFEWGSARTMPYAFMRNAATSVADRFEEE